MSRKNRLNVALVGCGDISSQYVEGCMDAANASLVKVMDINKRAARRHQAKYGVPATTSYREILADPAIEAVIISVPHFLHAPLARQAAAAGKHIMCDKPIATTLQDARSLIRTCEKYGVQLGVNYAMRTGWFARTIREIMRQGVIGELLFIKSVRCGMKRSSYWKHGYTHSVTTDWRAVKEKSGGGFLIMNSSHVIDLIRYVTGLEYASVTAQVDTLRTRVEVEDVGVAIIRMENKAFFTIGGGTIMPGTDKRSDPMTIYGTRGRIICTYPLRVYTQKKVKGFKPNDWTILEPKGQQRHGYGPYIEQFVDSVICHKKPLVTGEDGLKALAVVLAMYKSSETGRTVYLKNY